ncbi:MAG: LysR family transcriptional regulator [Myxococcales bacterium]|nr:LysR family transcriptional regulator [Myxococcales bacterium]
MNLEDLRVFVAVCEAGTLSAVGRELGCTQPAVAQRVTRLEREVGVALLDRRPRGVVPTPAGEIMRRAAVDAIGLLRGAMRELDALRTGRAGSVRLCTGPTTVQHFMQRSIVAFRRRYPEVSLDLWPRSSTRGCLEELTRQPLDLAFVTVGIPWSGVEQRAVLEASHVLLVREDHRLARRKTIRAGELRDLSFIGLRSYISPASQLARELAEHGVVIRATTVVEDWDTAAMMVGLGLGEAIVPSVHASSFVRGGKVHAVRIRGLQPMRFGWAARRFADLAPVSKDFVALVDQSLARLGELPGCRYLPT